jgi:hypothetical protein
MVEIMNLCPPALIYIAFSFTQIIIDAVKGYYNTAFMKFFVMIVITALLNILCKQGLGIISWIIVFIPFIMMTIITSMLLYVFGLNPTTGKFDNNCIKNVSLDQKGNIIIYDPAYDPIRHPVYYNSPNLVVPAPVVY